MDWKKHLYRAGSQSDARDELPDGDALPKYVASARKHIEPWLSAVFQAEHLNLLVGSGLTIAVGDVAGASATGMSKVSFGTEFDGAIDAHATAAAAVMKRGTANIEDQLRSALQVIGGLEVTAPEAAEHLRSAVNQQLSEFLASLLETEAGIATSRDTEASRRALGLLQSFLLSFAGRAASRERLNIFTTNYDRLIEHGCDLAGLRVIDRFVGALTPVFRAARVEVDFHYNPPGIRGEPRFMEGVVRLTKLHGSLDWAYDKESRRILRRGVPFGAGKEHSEVPKRPIDTVMIYPNPAKDVETTQYPYAELFRDFAASVCRPNSVIVIYGYGFGDDHVNRVLLDMLTIPSTHVVVIARSATERLKAFSTDVRPAQMTLLLGTHFSDFATLVEHYLPKPGLDYISSRMTDLLKRRPGELTPRGSDDTSAPQPEPQVQ